VQASQQKRQLWGPERITVWEGGDCQFTTVIGKKKPIPAKVLQTNMDQLMFEIVSDDGSVEHLRLNEPLQRVGPRGQRGEAGEIGAPGPMGPTGLKGPARR
jgi:hypothetical protein